MILATETEGLSRLFDLDFQLLADASLMSIAMFFLFMFASHYLFNPVRKMLQDRQNKIKGELEQAAQDQESAKESRRLYEEKLAAVEIEAEAILADARKRGMENEARIVAEAKEEAAKNTIAYGILEAHNTSGNMDSLKIKFDCMASHDITYVGIIQTARASGMEKFPIPYVLTNCHNSLCAVGGTINEDDHMFGLSAAKKYGGIYVPAHQAVIHQFMREMKAGCGKMI